MSQDDWNRHWNEYAESAGMNPAQAYRRRLIQQFLRDYLAAPPRRIVDIGSGPGDLATELSLAYPAAAVLGVELSEAGVAIAAERVPGATFVQHDLTRPLPPESEHRGWADSAACSEVLEHLDDPAAFLRNAAELMAPGCVLVVTVPGGPMSAFDLHLGHRRHYSPDSLRVLLTEAGFDVKAVHGAGYPFFNLYRLVVVLRGKCLIRDVSSGATATWARRLADSAMWVFDKLFLLNRSRGSWGWQTVAVGVIQVSACRASSRRLRPAKVSG